MADHRTPTPGEIVIMASGAVALIFSFFDFVGNDFDSRSVWGSGYFPIATLMVILVTIQALHIALTKFANVQLPERVAGFTWVQIHLVLGFFAALMALTWLIAKLGIDRKIGFWFILIGCIGAFVGAILLQREREGAAGGPVGGPAGGRPGGTGPTV